MSNAEAIGWLRCQLEVASWQLGLDALDLYHLIPTSELSPSMNLYALGFTGSR
jgi:hypothetical protein